MAATQNVQILLTERPRGALSEAHFKRVSVPLAKPEPGQVLVRNILLSLDAANRAWMQGRTYRDAVSAGEVMSGFAVGEVVESTVPELSPGTIVTGDLGWQHYAALPARHLQKALDHRPLSHLLSVLGVTGKTAYHGLLKVGQPKPGETVLVSAAAGAAGSFVAQIARIKGCRVVGVAGGAEKCAWLKSTLGCDEAVDYKAGDLPRALKAACPNGIDVYFDNTGGAILEAALFNMRRHGRIVCCGAVSQYDTAEPRSPRGVPGMLVVNRVRMEGFIVMDFSYDDAQAITDLKSWVKDGRLKVIEDVIDGLDAAPQGLVGLLAGQNRGKRMIRIAPDPA